MLTEIYIEAIDEELADQVWEAWDKGEADDDIACIAWLLIENGKGNTLVIEAMFRCRDCGEIVEKQVRPLAPEIGGSVAYLPPYWTRFFSSCLTSNAGNQASCEHLRF